MLKYEFESKTSGRMFKAIHFIPSNIKGRKYDILDSAIKAEYVVFMFMQ